MPDLLHGLGAIPSPPDDRDYPIDALYAALGIDLPVTLPAAFASVPVPPILDQGLTPECVAYSTAGMKDFQDYDDQAPARWWNFDEGRFFSLIGGGSNGAILRNAMDQLLKVGYPVVGDPAAETQHKIAAYYAVPITMADIKAAIATFGEVVFGVQWQNSWSSPNVAGVLPAADYTIGGHAIRCRGWDDSKGFRLSNSWGSAWAVNGECYLPYRQLIHVFEIWKAPDQPKPPPPSPALFHWHVQHGAPVKVYQLDSPGAILPGWTTTIWLARSSSAPCAKPVFRATVDGKSHATTVKVLSGAYAGKTVGVSPPGTSVT
jgi:hypothetical protein